MNEPSPLTPNGVAILTMMNGEYRRKVLKALEQVRTNWDCHEWPVMAIDACIEAVRAIELVDT
jgi:hypothetical protein